MQKVTFYASQVEMAQVQPNDIYMSVLMRMFSTRPNRNGFAVSEGCRSVKHRLHINTGEKVKGRVEKIGRAHV